MEKKTLVSIIILAVVLIAAGIFSALMKKEYSDKKEVKSQHTQQSNTQTSAKTAESK